MRLSPFRAGGNTTIWTRPLAAFAPPGETPGDAFYPLPLKEPAAGSWRHSSPRIATAIPPTLILIGGWPGNAQKRPNFLCSRRSGRGIRRHLCGVPCGRRRAVPSWFAGRCQLVVACGGRARINRTRISIVAVESLPVALSISLHEALRAHIELGAVGGDGLFQPFPSGGVAPGQGTCIEQGIPVQLRDVAASLLSERHQVLVAEQESWRAPSGSESWPVFDFAQGL